jgi:hypothetical protein
MPGHRLRYRLEVEKLGTDPLLDFAIRDELDRLNAPAAFQPGSLVLLSAPPGADTSNTSPTGGPQGTGLVDVRNLALPALNDTAVVEFEVTLASVLPNGTTVANQS